MKLPIRDRVSDPGAIRTADERVYARIAAGDAESLRRLFSRHAPLTVSIIAHLVGRSQAQDIVQETFIMLWNRRWHRPDEGSVQTWVLGMAHSRALELIREGEVLPRPTTGGALRTIVDAGALPRPKADSYTLARQAVVLRALMALPVDERTTLELMYFPRTLSPPDRRTARCAAVGDPEPFRSRAGTTRAVAQIVRTAGSRRSSPTGSDQPRIRASRYPAGSALPRVNR
jgi:RNA polymerase sigma factor (sigma-70 family)